MHKHKCPKCNLVWEHSDNGGPTRGIHEAIHHCPGCGAEQYRAVRSKDINVNVAHCVPFHPSHALAGQGRPPIELLFLLAELDRLARGFERSRLKELDKNRAT